MTASSAMRKDVSTVDRLSPKNFRRLSEFISDYSGIKMPPNKQTMLEGRLRRRLRATGLPSLDAYCAYLFDQDGLGTEIIHLIDVVTTNKTDFFREAKHFDFLREVALPAIVDEGRTSLRLWSAACSVGAEPYSMAMVVDDFADSYGPLSYFILATDLSTDVLAAAQKGIYPESMLAPVPASLRRKYVNLARQPGSRSVRIAPMLRSRIGFARLNFMDSFYPVGEAMDVIFCRNVLIYFDKPTQSQVLARLCDCLRPGGFLIIGHSETVAGFNLPLRTVSNTVFRKL
jgi:chemotaxis protein methyltransferase CheR